MNSKYSAEIKKLIQIYEINDNIEPGSASGFASALGGLAKSAYGTYNYYVNFKKFYKYALRQANKINAEAINIKNLSANAATNDVSLIKRKSKFQFIINQLRKEVQKWEKYLYPLESSSAEKSKAALQVIRSIIDNAEYGNIKKRGTTGGSTNTQVSQTPTP